MTKSYDIGVVFVIHGVADRDPLGGERVCMFFPTKLHCDEFVAKLPGQYSVLEVSGIDYDAIDIKVLEP